MESLISAGLISGFNALVVAKGGDPAALLLRAGLSADAEDHLDGFISFQKFARLLEIAATELECADFGLQLSARQGLSILGPLAILASNLSTVTAAFEAIGRYMHLQIPALKLSLEPAAPNQALRISVIVVGTASLPLSQFYELIVGNGQKITHILAGGQFPAQRISFIHQPRTSKARYREFFSCEVSFSQDYCSVELAQSLAARSVAGADPHTAEIAASYLAALPPQDGLSGQVLQFVHTLLPTGQCRIHVVAKHLNLHQRTLQRRLASEGLLFEDLVDDARKTLAKRYLAEPKLELTRVAGLLGYADQSALNRSCRRWFDATPKQLRFRSN